tara:strand:+ start:754 stop:1320 length:567 start_codon:yes stop_codon:yes gene_type:complete
MLSSAYTIIDVVGETAVADMVGEKAESMADMVGEKVGENVVGDGANSCGALFQGDGTDACCGGNKTNKRVDKCTLAKSDHCGHYWSQVSDEDTQADAYLCYKCTNDGTGKCMSQFTTECKFCDVCYDASCYDATLPCASGWGTCPKNDTGGKRSKDSCDKLPNCTWGVPCYYTKDCPGSTEVAEDVHV